VDDCVLSGQIMGEATFRITHSPEMRPWKQGTGYYDRPIARRVAEEGIPRANSSHRKLGAGMISDRALNAESESDFQDFLGSEVPDEIRGRRDPRPLHERLENHRGLARLRVRYSQLPLADSVLNAPRPDRLRKMWNSARLYEFHGGFGKLGVRHR
jgi:hypothetical protein